MFIFSNKREDYFLLLLMGGPAATGLLQKLDGQLGVLGFVLETGTGKGGVGLKEPSISSLNTWKDICV